MEHTNLPEAWMRGPIPGIDPLLAPVLFSFTQAREDLEAHTESLTPARIWLRPFGFGSVGFHIRHIAGSADRLTTYLKGERLTPAQFAALHAEMQPGASRDELLQHLNDSLARSEDVIRTINPAALAEARVVGRMRLPTTVIGLLVHLAEHTQRHVGQAICAAKLARAMPSLEP